MERVWLQTELETSNKSIEKKFKKQLKLKDQEMEDLHEELKSLETQKPRDSKDKTKIKELEDKIEELEVDIESKNEKIKSQDKKLNEMRSKCNNFETQVEELKSEIDKLNKNNMDLIEAINNQKNHTEKIIESKEKDITNKKFALQKMIEKIEQCKAEITELNKTVAQNMTDLEFYRNALQEKKDGNENIKNVSNLEQKMRILEDEINHIKVWKFKIPSNQITNRNYLKLKQSGILNGGINILKEFNQILRNQMKTLMKMCCRDRNQSSPKSNKSMLNEINKHTGNKFDDLEDCISFINKLSNTDKRRGKDYDQNENFRGTMGSDKCKHLELENDELLDKIYSLESASKSIEKKYKKQLKLKQEELDELQEELESAKTKKPKDNKNKIQIKELQEKIEELEGDIESKNQEIKSKDKKLKEIEYKCNNFETRINELEKEIDKLQKDKIELTQKINNLKKEMNENINAKDEEINKKQKGMDNMKLKIETDIREAEEMKATIAQHVVDLDEFRSALKAEKERFAELNVTSNDQQRKINANDMKNKKLEEEIISLKVARFKNPENNIGNKYKWYPNWWDKYMVPDHHNRQQENRKFKQIAPDIPKNPDRKSVAANKLLACPNCQTMYSPAESY